jgi:hypothetical protein
MVRFAAFCIMLYSLGHMFILAFFASTKDTRRRKFRS